MVVALHFGKEKIMLKAYIVHLGVVIMAHKDLKIGLASGVTGAASYEVGERSNIDMWVSLGHLGVVVSICVGCVALMRSLYSFRKEIIKDRLEALKITNEIKEKPGN